jgi:hypothetical protein
MSDWAEKKATARSETKRVREILFATAIVTSILWGCATAGMVLAAGGWLGHAAHLSDTYFNWMRFAAACTGLSFATIRFWRRRHAHSLSHVGLWVEERVPRLQYALVASLDPELPLDSPLRPPLEAVVEKVNLPGVALRAAVPAYIRAALLVLIVAVAVSDVMPLEAVDRTAANGPPATNPASTTHGGRRLAGWSVHIVPPAYAHARPTDLTDPSTIAALVGSTITLRGPGSPDGLSAPMPITAAANGWQAVFPMPRDPTVVRFTDGAASRVVALVPRADEPPTVLLELPRADTTYRTPPKAIVLEARATDDIALADGWFECIVSTGETEGNFKSTTDTVAHVTFHGTRTGVMRATLSLPLAAGMQLSIRAIARDGNDVTGPGVGTSDTRTLRIASPQEYDSLAVAAAAPPELDKALMSQRMLVMKTEALVARRARMDHGHYVSESVRLGDTQAQLRQEVDDILNAAPASDSGGEGEPGERDDIDASKGGAGVATATHERGFFQVAYQAMTDAARSLAVGLPDTALPPERTALAALDSARVMNRLYLRGTPPTIVVNTARVRLAGPAGGPTADTAAPAVRSASPRADSVRTIVLRYIEQPVVRADSLSLLQVATLSVDTALATALGDAAAARDSVHLREALARVRREAAPVPRVTPGLGPAGLARP